MLGLSVPKYELMFPRPSLQYTQVHAFWMRTVTSTSRSSALFPNNFTMDLSANRFHEFFTPLRPHISKLYGDTQMLTCLPTLKLSGDETFER